MGELYKFQPNRKLKRSADIHWSYASSDSLLKCRWESLMNSTPLVPFNPPPAVASPWHLWRGSAHVGLQLLLLVATCTIYFNSIQGAFVFDDGNYIKQDGIKPFGMQRWIGQLTFEWNHRWGGLDPTGYHLVNIFIHAAAGITLFWLVLSTVKLLDRKQTGLRAEYLAFVVSACWLCHPLQTESVTYVIQRFESLASLFFLLTLLGVANSATNSGIKAWAWGGFAVTACSLGMATKEIVAMAPLVVLLYDRTFLAKTWRELIRRRWLIYTLMLPAIIWLAIQLHSMVLPAEQNVDHSVGFGVSKVQWYEYLQTQPQVLLHYVWLTFWPRELVLDYAWPIARIPGEIVPAAAVILLLLSASLWALWKHPPIGWIGISFFLILAPTSSFMPIVDLAFEHRMYLPLAALITAIVLGCHELLKRYSPAHLQKRFAVVTFLLVIVALGMRTIRRNEDYRSGIVMWQSVLASSPKNVRAMNNLAICLHDAGRDLEGIPYLRQACAEQQNLPSDPTSVKLRANLGKMLLKNNPTPAVIQEALTLLQSACELAPQNLEYKCFLARGLAQANRTLEAIQVLNQAKSIDPGSSEVLHSLGVIYLKGNQAEEALTCLQQAASRSPLNAEIHSDLAVAYEANQSLDKARECHAEAVRLAPARADFRLRIGTLHHRMGADELAEEQYRASLQLDTHQSPAHLNLGLLLSKKGEQASAIRHLQSALQSDSRLAAAHFELARLRFRNQQWAQAATHWKAGLQIEPKRADVHNELGLTLLKTGDRQEAESEFHQAIELDAAHAPAYVNLGALQLQLGRLAEAEAFFQTALEHQPTLAQAQKGLARCELLKTRTARAPR
jgi:protein O-mannosyl-transferase